MRTVARIAVDARVITGERDGVGRYASELLPALAAAAPRDEFLVLRHPSNRRPVAPGSPNVREVYVDGVVGALVDGFLADGRRLCGVFDAEGWPAVYHALFHMAPLAFPGRRRPRPATVVTLHDLIWLDHPFAHGSVVNGIGAWLKARTAIVGTLRRADEVIAVSQATADAGRRWLDPGRTTVIHHGVAARFFEALPPLPPSLAVLADGPPVVAAVAESKKYKNLGLLLDAFALATRQGVDARLVLLGRCTSLAADARRLGVGDRVVFPGEVGDDVLRAVVGRAALFVHPALVEGFGMPVLEAMALGVPTAVADVPALSEVGGDAAVRFGPRDTSALAGVIGHLVTSPRLRDDLSHKALARARSFTWETCAQRTLAVYGRAMVARGGPAAVLGSSPA